MGKFTKVGPFTQTVGREGMRPADMFIVGHDKCPGPTQHLHRVIEREMMGQKKTPTANTILRKTKVSRS